MKRTTISLPDALAEALGREARRRNKSASEITRDALAAHLGFTADKPRQLPFAMLGRSGHRSTARDMEELIAREWDDPARGR
jgi:Arc/MetJ-type ribon-helix-helix transcriptional regulator